ncbi:MAG: DUF2975 domain-containing protein [Clostridia bacterium]|nr:DUF2975 domain-containing protein [Clostridia bacterium]
MNQKSLAIWMKVVLTAMGIFGLALFAVAVPMKANEFIRQYSGFEPYYLPWVCLVCATGIPCYGVIVLGWRIASNIGRDRSFCRENASCLKWVSFLSAGDSALLFIGSAALWLCGMDHLGILFTSFLVVFIGIAISAAAAILSHLVAKAAVLQEENDLTI